MTCAFTMVDLSQLDMPCRSANAPPSLVRQEADKSGDDHERGDQRMVENAPTVKC
jgi:hypothetical protein